MKLLIRNGLIITMNARREVLAGDLLVEGNRILKMGRRLSVPRGTVETLDASGQFVIPGLIQTHTHLVQALFRGDADDLSLLDWLKKRIWPMEAAHTASSVKASAEIGLLEMQKSGTTTILDMGTVHHTQPLIETARRSGIRYWGGKCLMDLRGSSGPLYEKTRDSLKETEDLISEWKSKDDRIRYALCPRFAISCTEELLEATADFQRRNGLIIHTHASENRDEVALVKKRTGLDNISYFKKLGLLTPQTVIAHGIHVNKRELGLMIQNGTSVTHCPSSNLKLASGVAPIYEYRKRGLNVCLGADGAPCNNSMDPFIEMRLAALLQKPLFGPEALPAYEALEMATVAGARALGASDDLGSLEPGKLADIVTVRRSHPSVATVENPYSALVYSCLGRDVAHVVTDGRVVVRDGHHQIFDEDHVIARARRERRALLKRL